MSGGELKLFQAQVVAGTLLNILDLGSDVYVCLELFVSGHLFLGGTCLLFIIAPNLVWGTLAFLYQEYMGKILY